MNDSDSVNAFLVCKPMHIYYSVIEITKIIIFVCRGMAKNNSKDEKAAEKNTRLSNFSAFKVVGSKVKIKEMFLSGGMTIGGSPAKTI